MLLSRRIAGSILRLTRLAGLASLQQGGCADEADYLLHDSSLVAELLAAKRLVRSAASVPGDLPQLAGDEMAFWQDRAWIVAAAYLAVAIEALVAAKVNGDRHARTCWGVIACMLLLFAVSKQLQVQGTITDRLRTVAGQDHLYGKRWILQYVSAAVALIVGAVFVRGVLTRANRLSAPVAAAALTTTALILFLLVRAASIHAIDPFMMKKIGGLRSGWWIELIGTGVIAIAAGASLRGSRRRP